MAQPLKKQLSSGPDKGRSSIAFAPTGGTSSHKSPLGANPKQINHALFEVRLRFLEETWQIRMVASTTLLTAKAKNPAKRIGVSRIVFHREGEPL